MLYRMKQVTVRTGIPAVTVRAWEQRYGAVEPARTDRGQRLYTERDVQALLWLKEKTGRGMAISQAVRVLKQTAWLPEQAPPEPVHPAKPADGTGETAYAAWQERIYAELAGFQGDAAHGLLEAAFASFSLQEVFHRILAPILLKAGDDWEAGELSVAQEHYISHFVQQRFTQFFRLFPVNPRMPRFVAFCPEGEQHQLGLLMFSLFLRQHGAEVTYLGADMPMDGLGPLIRRKAIAYACVSLTMQDRAGESCRMLRDLQKENPGLKLVLGGRGFGQAELRTGWTLLRGGWQVWKEWLDGVA